MTRRFAMLIGAMALLPCPGGARAAILADSTTLERFTLPNGLEVVTRHIPRAASLTVSLGFRHGSDADPRDFPGLARLLAEVAYTAPAGGTPERSRQEMDSIRPQGWALRVNPITTVLTEGASRAQFPGVLHELAARLRGVTVNEEAVRHALATTRTGLGELYFGDPGRLLMSQARELARGRTPADIVAIASGRALERLTAKRVQAELARVYVPSNAVLAIAGDLSAWDIASLVRSEFGGIPAGTRLAEPPPVRLDSAAVLMRRPEVASPLGVVGVIAPAFQDSLYPSFVLAMVLISTQTDPQWGRPEPPLATRFMFSVLDDPTLATFYPRLRPEQSTLQALGREFDDRLSEMMEMTITAEAYQAVAHSIGWLFGDAMPPGVVGQMRQDPAALNQLGANDALRALLGSDAFWSRFRARLAPEGLAGVSTWADYLNAPSHRSLLLLLPR